MTEQPRHDVPPRPAFPDQNADGIDLTLIRENLKLTPLERVRKADAPAAADPGERWRRWPWRGKPWSRIVL